MLMVIVIALPFLYVAQGYAKALGFYVPWWGFKFTILSPSQAL